MTPDCLMRWKVLIMGASTTSSEYKVFLGLGRLKVISDDSIIYARNQEEHDLIVGKALDRVKENGLILNFEKCEFNLKEIKFFGVILSAEGIRTDPDKS